MSAIAILAYTHISLLLHTLLYIIDKFNDLEFLFDIFLVAHESTLLNFIPLPAMDGRSPTSIWTHQQFDRLVVAFVRRVNRIKVEPMHVHGD